jgi:hypothetical protein
MAITSVSPPSTATLPTWIDAVDASQLPGLTGFALHLHRDFDAVTAGLTLDWNSGSIEGAVNRIKKIKRQLRPSRIRTTPQDDLASMAVTTVLVCHWPAR